VVPVGTTSDTPVVSTDLLPTVFAAAGAPAPDGRPIDGCNLVPLLSRGETPPRDTLFWHYPHYSNQGGFPGSAVRMGNWKLIQRLETGRLHLYNLRDDPGERNDLAAAEPERAAQMKTRLHAWFRETGARFLRQKPGGPKPWRPDDGAPVVTPAKTSAQRMAYGMDFERLWS
jgi:arylsulfatase A-like enzyme